MCIQTGKLCNNCQDKLDSGEITNLDIEIGKELMNIAKSVKFLSNITLLKTKNREKYNLLIIKDFISLSDYKKA